MAIVTKAQMVTPECAVKMLEYNSGNYRVMGSARVTAYAREMTSGNWDMNGETIKFHADGTLLDGQHRLHAVVRSGVAVEMLVVRGIISMASHIDRGKPRTIAQWLAHNGVKHACTVAAISRWGILHDKGRWPSRGFGVEVATDSESIEFADKYADEIQSACRGPRVKGMPASVLGAIMFLGCGKGHADENAYTKWFRQSLATGVDLNGDEPVLHLRNRLVNQTASKSLTPYMARMTATMAWNKTVLGEGCKPSTMRMRLTGPNKTNIPQEVLVAAATSQ